MRRRLVGCRIRLEQTSTRRLGERPHDREVVLAESLNVSQAMPAPSAQGDARRPPERLSVRSGPRLWVESSWRDQLATRGDSELAVDVARVGTDRLDTDLQSEGDLGIGATLLEQRQDFGLALRQQESARDRSATGELTRAESPATRARRDGSR